MQVDHWHQPRQWIGSLTHLTPMPIEPFKIGLGEVVTMWSQDLLEGPVQPAHTIKWEVALKNISDEDWFAFYDLGFRDFIYRKEKTAEITHRCLRRTLTFSYIKAIEGTQYTKRAYDEKELAEYKKQVSLQEDEQLGYMLLGWDGRDRPEPRVRKTEIEIRYHIHPLTSVELQALDLPLDFTVVGYSSPLVPLDP